MPFILLLLLALTCMPVTWPEPPSWLGEGGSVLLTWGGLALLTLAAVLVTRRFQNYLAAEPESHVPLFKRYNRLRRRYSYFLLGFYFLCLFYFGWGYTLYAAWPGQPQQVPGLQIVLLAPFLLGLMASWLCFYHVEKAVHDHVPWGQPFPGALAYLALQVRHNLLLVVPPLFLLLFEQTLFYFWPSLQESNALLPFLAIGLLTVAFLSIPLLLRWFLGLKPMPACPLRDRLEETARRLKFRFSNILVWDTRNTIGNAMVTGLLPWMRYIVVTDRLIQELTHEEVEAVFGHEVGHVRHHHMLFYILFLLGSVMLLGAVGQVGLDLLRGEEVKNFLGDWVPALVRHVENNEVFVMVPLLALIALYVFLVFGYISRRCERQADLYGARATTCQAFIDALEKVAHINGISRDKPGWLSSWQHGTIGQRVAFIAQLRDNPNLGTRFQWRLGIMKWGMALGLMGFLSLSVLILGPERVWELLKHM